MTKKTKSKLCKTFTEKCYEHPDCLATLKEPVYRLVYGVIREDEYGKSIELFNEKEKAMEFFDRVNKIHL